MAVVLLILGIILFIGLILIHEWGHFIAAKKGGVEVEEYSVFFPPKLYKRKTKGGWQFVIGALPLGGYVKLKGEHDTDTAKGSYGAADLWTKTKIMGAGVFMNLVTAFLLLMVLAWLGMPKIMDNQFTVASDTKVISRGQHHVVLEEVTKNQPAAKAGLKRDDILQKIADTPVADVKSLQQASKKYAGQTVTVTYERAKKQQTATATLNSVESQQGKQQPTYLGVSISEVKQGADLRRSTWSAPIVAGGLIGQFTWATLQGLGNALQGLGSLIAGAATGNTVARQHGQSEAAGQVSGPIGIVMVLNFVSHMNYQFMLLIIALISLTLAIMNLLPIPALDGGRLWLTLISRGIFKKPLTQKVEENVNAAGFFILIGLTIIIAFVDIKRFF